MSHILNAFIVKEKDLSPFIRRKSLEQDLVIVPIDEWFISQFPELEGTGTKGFSELFCNNNPIVTVFTDYFGGIGEQKSHYYDGNIVHEFTEGFGPIDKALKMLGVVCTNNNDEFDSIGLGKYRDTSEVLGQPIDLKKITDDDVRSLYKEILYKRDNGNRPYSHFYPYADKWTSGAFTSTRTDGLTIYRGSGPIFAEPFYIDSTGHFYMKYDESLNVLDNLLNKLSTFILEKSPDDESAIVYKKAADEKNEILLDLDFNIRKFLSSRNYYLTVNNTL